MRNEIWCPLNVYFPFLSHHKVFDGRVSFPGITLGLFGHSQQRQKGLRRNFSALLLVIRHRRTFFSRTDKTDFVFRMMDDDGPFIWEENHQRWFDLEGRRGDARKPSTGPVCVCSYWFLPDRRRRQKNRPPLEAGLRAKLSLQPFSSFLSIERLTESSEMSRIINALWISPRTLFTLCEINQTQNFNNFNNKSRGLREKSAISFFRSSLSLTSFNYTRKLNGQHGIRWVNANRNKKVDKGVDWIVPVVLIKINRNEKRSAWPGRD